MLKIPAGDKPTLQLLNCFKYNDVSGASQHRIFIIDSVAARWGRLGLALNISGYYLDNIEHSSHRNYLQASCKNQVVLADYCVSILATQNFLQCFPIVICRSHPVN